MVDYRNNMIWCEIYRPQTVKECILPDRLKRPFQEYVNQESIPNLLLCGGPGVGKTTIAIAMCEEIGCDYMFINGSEENGIDVLRTKIKSYASSVSLSGGRKVIIIDEADNMTAGLQQGLKASIEEFSNNCSFIFTCNIKNKIIQPIHSRCAVIDFKLIKQEKIDMAGKLFNRILEILNQKEIQYDKKVIAELVQRYFPDYRRTLNELQRLSQFGSITVGSLTQISNESFSDVVKYLADKDYNKVDKWVKENSDLDPSTFYRDLYDFCHNKLKPECIPQMILILAKYQYQAGFVADQTINTLACMVELMVDCEFK